MKVRMMALLAGAGLLCASPAAAQDDPWMAQVAAQLSAVVDAVAREGLSPAADPATGALPLGGVNGLELELSAGQYLIAAVCDDDCTDLDLVLTDADGNEVASDLETDATPVLTVELDEARTLTLAVRMVNCSSAPCRYGVGMYSVD